MSKIVLSSSSNSIDKAIDEYRDSSSYTDYSSHSSSSSSNSRNTIEEYTFSVLGVPLEVFQEHLRTRVASRPQVGTSTSVPPSTPVDEVETVYSCDVGIPSKTNEKRLASLRS